MNENQNNQSQQNNVVLDNVVDTADCTLTQVDVDNNRKNLIESRKRRRKELRRKLLLRQILLFTIIGGICFIIDYGVMLILTELLNLNLLLANTISCTLAMICNYFLTMRFVFYRKRNVPRYAEIGIFVLISVLGIGLSQLLMWLGTKFLLMSYRLVKVIATVIVTIFNFIVKKIVVSAK